MVFTFFPILYHRVHVASCFFLVTYWSFGTGVGSLLKPCFIVVVFQAIRPNHYSHIELLPLIDQLPRTRQNGVRSDAIAINL
jgi:hypothetical protein